MIYIIYYVYLLSLVFSLINFNYNFFSQHCYHYCTISRVLFYLIIFSMLFYLSVFYIYLYCILYVICILCICFLYSSLDIWLYHGLIKLNQSINFSLSLSLSFVTYLRFLHSRRNVHGYLSF